jgi:hypothetical protein
MVGLLKSFFVGLGVDRDELVRVYNSKALGGRSIARKVVYVVRSGISFLGGYG